MDETKIAALLCSRLCHDLVSPIGALNNGVEVLEEETSASIRKEALVLLSESARAAIGRLLFFRVAFGSASGFGSDIAMREVRQAAEGLFANSRVKLDWPKDADANGALPKSVAKLLLNLVMIAGEALQRGGTVMPRIERRPDGLMVAVTAKGAGVQLHESAADALAGRLKTEDLDVRTAQPWLVRLIAAEIGASLETSVKSQDSIEFNALIRGAT